jgi:DNA-binding NtrC family response regulator
MSLLPKLLVLCEDAEVRSDLKQSFKHSPMKRVFYKTKMALRKAIGKHAGDAVVFAGDHAGSKMRDVMEWPEVRESHLPVIAVSRYGETRDYLAAMEAGAFDYMAGPLRAEEVRRIVKNAIRKEEAEEVEASK